MSSNEHGRKLESTKDFDLYLGEGVLDPDRRDLPTFKLVDRKYNVVVAEGGVRAAAIRSLHHSQQLLDAVLADPDGSKGQAAQQAQLAELQGYLSGKKTSELN